MLTAILAALILVGTVVRLLTEDVRTIHPERQVSLHMRRWKAHGWTTPSPVRVSTAMPRASRALYRV